MLSDAKPKINTTIDPCRVVFACCFEAEQLKQFKIKHPKKKKARVSEPEGEVVFASVCMFASGVSKMFYEPLDMYVMKLSESLGLQINNSFSLASFCHSLQTCVLLQLLQDLIICTETFPSNQYNGFH